MRLGFKGPQEVKDHVWFQNFPWKELLEKKINAFFKPSVNLILFRLEIISMRNIVNLRIK